MKFNMERILSGEYELDKSIEEKIPDVQNLCKRLNIVELYFFGSSVNGNFVPGKSDIDVLVYTQPEHIKNIVRLNFELKKIFNCPIDIFHKHWKKTDEFKKHLILNKVLIYKNTATNK